METNLQLIISEFLGVLFMPMFRIQREENWMTKEKNAFFLVLVISQKPTNYIILSPRRLLSVVMSYLMKKISGHGIITLLGNKFLLILMQKMKLSSSTMSLSISKEQQPTPTVPIVPPSPAIVETNKERPQRAKRRPVWMSDFEVTGADHSEDPLAHFALFSYCDLVVFEDAVKESKWQKDMDAEITAIEKNNTWKLVELPKGQKTIGVK